MRIKLAIVAALLALGVVGCSDSGDTGVASASGSPSNPTGSASPSAGNEQDQMLAYAQCMRDNGVPNFPDPQPDEGGQGDGLALPNGEGVDPGVSSAAQDKCRHLLPNGGAPPTMDPEPLEQLRRYAQCMRDHGVSSFPDPDSEGRIPLGGNNPQLDENNPTYQRANEACQQYNMPGGGGGQSSANSGGTP